MIKKAVYLERAPAKINLFLDVKGKRDDGYHDIDTVFQSISLSDHLTFSISVELGDSDDIEFSVNLDSNKEEIKDLAEDNLVTRAIEVYFTKVPQQEIISLIDIVNIDVFIDKQIPFEAGLAGGSADAAATLRALNKFFADNFDWSLSQKELSQLGAEIGSDVPFCVQALSETRRHATGRGEVFDDKEPEFDYGDFKHVIIVKPSFGISTAEAYQMVDEDKEELDGHRAFYNKFEKTLFTKFPELENIKKGLLLLGCEQAMLSGSGSSMLGFLKAGAYDASILEKAIETFVECEVSTADFL